MSKGPLVSLHGIELGFSPIDRRIAIRNGVYSVTMSPAAGSSNQTLVTMQLVDHEGASVAAVRNLDIWLSDDAGGAGLTATTASGTVGAGASGADLGTLTSKKALHVQTDATGKYILAITDTSKTAFKVCAQLGVDGGPIVGATLASANYG